MDAPLSPLDVPELLYHCLHPLQHSGADIAACALVSRSWAYPAQALLFADVIRDENRGFRRYIDQWERLIEVLESAPHLVHHIRRLRVAQPLAGELFMQIINLPFAGHLEQISLRGFEASHSTAVSLRHLLSLPNVRHLGIDTTWPDPRQFVKIWQLCSPSIKSLGLNYIQRSALHLVPESHTQAKPNPSPISIEFLRLGQIDGFLPTWLRHDAWCPFDFSRLRVLSIGQNTHVLDWEIFAPALQMLEALEIHSTETTPPISLSLFPQLTLFRINVLCRPWPSSVIQTFSTIPPSNRLRQIVIRGSFYDRETCRLTDAVLSGAKSKFGALEWVELQPLSKDLRPMPYFPELHRRGMVRLGHFDPFWFEGMATGSSDGL
ncbi:hypothetical protein FB45DRAFT_934864 [Roridomyces roridus]|uniref:F-box domain-containing protein n=1 Tax=Roridomyces roridus TaxID=1738132 RepID=A0AAD7BBC4_9AGAR|nr:hypothetical protein FB45DRAFT_934864 [Roridomyces roridus]